MSTKTVLSVKNIVKTFPGVKALDEVSFDLKKGEVHALIGENGAGKSTLMNILGGVFHPDSGQIQMNNEITRFDNPHLALNKGISVVFQELSLVPTLSIAENIFANRQPINSWNMIQKNKLYQETRETLKKFQIHEDPKTLVKDLSVAKQQVIEILKALSTDPQVLILDEPTSSLSGIFTQLLFENIKTLQEQGIAIIYISHHLKEIFTVAQRVTVLRDGKYIGTRNVEDVTEKDLVHMMVGRDVVNMYGERQSQIGPPFFQVKDLSSKDTFSHISFSIREGEILGLAGLIGAGRTEVGRAIFGAHPKDSGEILLDDKKLAINHPHDAIEERIGYLTEDRKEQGLYLESSVRENCIAPNLQSFTNKLGFMQEKSISEMAEIYRKQFNIITPSIFQRTRNLSGGNQQKVLLSMWFGIQPKILITDEPTRGVDVGAKNEIYALLRELAGKGVGILMISSDLPEILGVSDRIIVMRHGLIVGEFTKEEASEESIISCAAGVEDSSLKEQIHIERRCDDESLS